MGRKSVPPKGCKNSKPFFAPLSAGGIFDRGSPAVNSPGLSETDKDC